MKIKKILPQIVPYTPIIPALFAASLNRESGMFYGILGTGVITNPANIFVNSISIYPFLVLKTETFDRIGIYVRTEAAGNCRLGIYADNGSIKPSTLIVDAGAVDVSTTGDKAIVISQELAPGLYWLAYLANAAPSVESLAAANILGISGRSTTMYGGSSVGYYKEYEYGELPVSLSSLNMIATNSVPGICLRRA